MRIFGILLSLLLAFPAFAAERSLLNVSYDPTREFYREYNEQFAAARLKDKKEKVLVRQSHGGSGKQARAVIDGLEADVVTLALAYDIDAIVSKSGVVPQNWREKLPHDAAPFYSTIVFLVRKGNPKAIKDWGDLVKDGVQVITPNPKTSGGARWNYLAAWAWALEKNGGDEAKATVFMKELFAHVPVLDTGARGSTTTFAQRKMGDVLITWENEAYLAMNELGKDQFEIVYPSLSIKAETPVAVVEKFAEKHGTLELATAYLKGLYAPAAQKLAAEHYYRPTDADVAAQFPTRFPAIRMKSVDDFGGWNAAHEKHFRDGGVLDSVMIGGGGK